MFERLITVSGVGPKLAVSILAGMQVNELAVAIASNDARAISKVQGVGKKTAERLILELKEKIGTMEMLPAQGGAAVVAAVGDSAAHEAVEALMALGYSSMEAAKAVSAAGDVQDVETLIMTALKSMDRR